MPELESSTPSVITENVAAPQGIAEQSQSQPEPQQTQTPQTQSGMPQTQQPRQVPEEAKPMTMGRLAQKVSFNKNEYFSHDMKGYYRDKEGNTYLVTDAPEGDVKLDADQVAKLEKDREEAANRKDAQPRQWHDLGTDPVVYQTEEEFKQAQLEIDKRLRGDFPTLGKAADGLGEVAAGFVNEGDFNDEQMYNASLPRKVGRIAEEALSGYSNPNAYHAAKALEKFGRGEPLSDGEKWTLWKTGANVSGAATETLLGAVGGSKAISIVRKIF